MKIVVLTTSFPKNKKDYSGLFVLNYLKNTNLKSIVIAPHNKGLKKRETVDGIDVRRIQYAPENMEKLFYSKGVPDNIRKSPFLTMLSIPWMMKSSVLAIKLLKDDDILITNWAFPTGVIGAFIKKFSKKKIKHINIIHSAGLTILKNKNLKFLTKFLYENTDKLHFVNTEHISWFEKLIDKKIKKEKIILKPMPISTPIPNDRDTLPCVSTWGIGKNQLLYLGRIVKIKGLDLMLDELKSLKNINLTIAGDGNLKTELEQKYSYANFTGSVFDKKKQDLLNKSNIVIIPSISTNGQIEGFPTVILEAALSKSLLAISTEVKGIDYIYKDKLNCFYYNPYKKNELRDLVFYLSEEKNEKMMETMIDLSYNATLNILESYKLDFLSK